MDGVNETSASNFYLGKKVAYIYKAQVQKAGSKFRVVWGKIIRSHGTNGVLRAKFATNISVSAAHFFTSNILPTSFLSITSPRRLAQQFV